MRELKSRVKKQDALIADQARSFEQLVSKAQETTLLEAEEIARLEGELVRVQDELRKNRRSFKQQEKEVRTLKKGKSNIRGYAD